MSHPEQGQPAGHPAEQRGHERPGGYDEDPLQNAGAPGQAQGGQYGQRSAGGGYAEQLGGPGQQQGHPDQYGGQVGDPYGGQQAGQYGQAAGGGYTEQLGGPGQQPGHPDQHGGQVGGQVGGQHGDAYGGQQAGQYGQQQAAGGYAEQLGQPGQQPGQPGQHPGQAPGDQSFGPGPGGGAGGPEYGGEPGAYPGPPDHSRGAPGEPTGRDDDRWGAQGNGAPVGGSSAGGASGGGASGDDRYAGEGSTIIDPQRAEHWRSQWEDVRMMFVDQPRDAVARADGLVGEVLDELARTFTQQRSELDPNAVGDPSTEELRRAVQRYREFFDRLLTL
ncbi:hypothetical protein ACFPK1_00080 [Actinomycetospora rhizophila]|uniref:Uncharacterized protein n=1 Tax=Actinomycetospora rhizophila TaxID=1416876 RepID=A0ABV9Z513_9PSEU